MNIPSHLRLSAKLSGYFGLSVSERVKFMCGNIIPDITLSFLQCPHTPAEMSYSVMNEFCRQLDEANAGRRANFMRFGILIHFFADFFCSVHNHSIGQMQQFHYQYENCLELLISELPLGREMDMHPEQVMKFLISEHQNYLSEPFGLDRDIKYIPKVSTSVMSLMMECLRQQHPDSRMQTEVAHI